MITAVWKGKTSLSVPEKYNSDTFQPLMALDQFIFWSFCPVSRLHLLQRPVSYKVFIKGKGCTTTQQYRSCSDIAFSSPDSPFAVFQDDISLVNSFYDTTPCTTTTVAFIQWLLHPVHVDQYLIELCICLCVCERQTKREMFLILKPAAGVISNRLENTSELSLFPFKTTGGDPKINSRLACCHMSRTITFEPYPQLS